jgi:inner membrane protein
MRAIALVGAIVALDLLWSLVADSTGTIAYATIDEPAHLATCLVGLLALSAVLVPRPSTEFLAAALAASVAIDVDHIPGYLGWDGFTGTLPRPYSHSLLVVAVLLVVGRAATGRGRQILLGTAFGVGAHLLRDLATGPGVPLLWPVHNAAVVMPYAVYLGALALAVLATAARRFPVGAVGGVSGPRASPPVPSAYPPSGS